MIVALYLAAVVAANLSVAAFGPSVTVIHRPAVRWRGDGGGVVVMLRLAVDAMERVVGS